MCNDLSLLQGRLSFFTISEMPHQAHAKTSSALNQRMCCSFAQQHGLYPGKSLSQLKSMRVNQISEDAPPCYQMLNGQVITHRNMIMGPNDKPQVLEPISQSQRFTGLSTRSIGPFAS